MITIQVTADHIERGIATDSEHCPIAFAAMDAGLVEPCVTGTILSFERDGERWWHALPPSARSFVRNFDHDLYMRTGPVEPFAFQIDDSDPVFSSSLD